MQHENNIKKKYIILNKKDKKENKQNIKILFVLINSTQKTIGIHLVCTWALKMKISH